MNAIKTDVDLEIAPLAGRIGAEISSLDLAGDVDQDLIDAIGRALVEHKVLFLRGQFLTPEAHVAFANRLGTPTMAHPTVPSLSGHPHVFELDAASGARANVWHTDVTFVERPPRASILNAVLIPRVGGDTVWANTETAYAELPEHLRLLADGLWVQHSNKADYGGMTSAGTSYTSAFHSASFVARHPVVRVHPVSGRRSLLLGGFASRIEGVSASESADLIRTFQAHVTRPENTVRWRYRAGDLVIWDNQATQHYAIDDYGDAPRRVQRVTLVGDAARSTDGRTSETVCGDPAAYLSLG
jgi:alpha-ketoglutarate-dependent sulfate ester dioxygenase